MSSKLDSSNEMFTDNFSKSVNSEPMDQLDRRCRHLHDEAVFSIFSHIFKTLGRIFEQKEMVHHVHVK